MTADRQAAAELALRAIRHKNNCDRTSCQACSAQVDSFLTGYDALAAAGLLRKPGTVEVRPGQAVTDDGQVWNLELTGARQPDQRHLNFQVYNDMHFGNMGERWVWVGPDTREAVPERFADAALGAALVAPVADDPEPEQP